MAREKDSIHPPAPRENPLLFGHDAAEKRFLDDQSRGLMHHAYLVTGPKGIGKATFVYRLARYMLGQGALKAAAQPDMGLSLFGDALPATEPSATAAHTLDLPADDPLFRRIAAGSHTDLLTLSPAFDAKKQVEKGQISAEEARRVPEFLSLTPAEGDWRVVIVDAVDQLNTHAANALLKILEEPPANALLFLICHEPGGVLPTIRSRCRLFSLDAPDRQAFEQVLQAVAPTIDLHDYAALYGLAYGSPGLAITLTKHQGLQWYERWLNAMRPGATDAVREEFAQAASALKSPEAWQMLLHGWHVAMHRLSLFPAYDVAHPIFSREREWLGEIADHVPRDARQRWLSAARQLIRSTDTYNLDKRYSLRFLLDAKRLETQFPAVA